MKTTLSIKRVYQIWFAMKQAFQQNTEALQTKTASRICHKH